MSYSYAIVWLDAKEAHVHRFNAEDVVQKRLDALQPFRTIRHKAGVIGAGRLQYDLDYFDRIVDAMRGITEWLLIGPGAAKNQLLHHIETHIPWLKDKLAGIESMDHLSDGQLADHVRRFLRVGDELRPLAS